MGATTIVVGYDRSDQALPALKWAANEARLRGSTLEVIHAWSKANHVIAQPLKDPEHARKALQDQIEVDVRALLEMPDLDLVVNVVADDRPSHALAVASARAALLVVCSQGRSASVAHVLHSAAQQLVETARCPLVIIPPKGRDRATVGFDATQVADAREAALSA
jgi:nucleotide-binding universal stress UspA family protein